MLTCRVRTLVRRVVFAAALPLLVTVVARAAETPQAVAALRAPAQANRVAAHPDFTARVQLAGHLPAWAKASAQMAQTVSLSEAAHATVVLRRDAAVQAAFEKLLADQQNPGSPMYHQWLTPEQIGQLYGPTDADLAAVTTWLASEGLTIDSVQPNRVLIDVSAPVATMASAFRTNFGMFRVNGEARVSAAADASIPVALAGVIDSVAGLSQRHYGLSVHTRAAQGTAQAQADGTMRPQVTASDGSHYVMPADFNLIYDLASVQSGGNTGATIGSTAQHIAIIARSRVASADMSAFESLTGVPSVQPNVVLAGNDPGYVKGDQGEATLDAQRVISTAPGAQADLVLSASTAMVDGIYIDTAYNVNTLKDPVMSLSFGLCESEAGSGDSTLYSNLFSTGAAGGMSIFVSSGDTGAQGCGSAGDPAVTGTPSANVLCNAYATCVGGTEFADFNSPSTYWSSQNTTGYRSALSYIPEGAWNEPTNGATPPSYVMASTGGGPSIFVSKPSWQTGAGVPNDNARDTPDIAFSSADHDGYFGCLANDGNQVIGGSCLQNSSGGFPFVVFSGTSAAAPGMAGIAALLNTKTGKAQGLLNPLLYQLAASTPSAFHDVTVASSGVANCSVNVASMCNNSTPSTGSLNAGVVGFLVGTGYDEATGLGSLDVANFLTAAAVTTTSTTIGLTATPNPGSVNSPVALTATITPATSGGAALTGTVQFSSNGTAIGSAVTVSNGTATLNYSFTTPGTYAITASYSGDSNYGSATTTVSVSEVISASFTVTPATTAYGVGGNIVSGTPVQDAITVASIAPFAGTVNLTCGVTAATTSAADVAAAQGAACSLAPTTAVLTSGSSSASVLTITSTAGTAGSINVVVTGTSGTTVNQSSTINVKLTASSFMITPNPPATITVLGGATTGNTANVTVTSYNNFVGTVTMSCTAINAGGATGLTAQGSCTATPVTLTAGGTATSTVTLTSVAGTYGVLNLVVSGTGTTAGATTPATASCGSQTSPCITATISAPFTVTVGAIASVTSGTATTGAVSLASYSAVAQNVALTCAMTLTSGSPAYPASCAVSPASVALAANGTAAATVTISSHTAVFNGSVSGVKTAELWWMGGALAGLLGLGLTRRRNVRWLAVLLLCVAAAAGVTGCGNQTVPASTTPQSSAGTYSLTVTGTAGGTAVTSQAVTVTIQ